MRDETIPPPVSAGHEEGNERGRQLLKGPPEEGPRDEKPAPQPQEE